MMIPDCGSDKSGRLVINTKLKHQIVTETRKKEAYRGCPVMAQSFSYDYCYTDSTNTTTDTIKDGVINTYMQISPILIDS